MFLRGLDVVAAQVGPFLCTLRSPLIFAVPHINGQMKELIALHALKFMHDDVLGRLGRGIRQVVEGTVAIDDNHVPSAHLHNQSPHKSNIVSGRSKIQSFSKWLVASRRQSASMPEALYLRSRLAGPD
jgi:hypothetical protein